MRYADTFLKKHKGHPLPFLRNRFRSGEDPDVRMENFLMGRGEFSAEAQIRFEKDLVRDIELKMMGAM